jgi:hypothetical protein
MIVTEFLLALAFPAAQILGLLLLGLACRVDRKDGSE